MDNRHNDLVVRQHSSKWESLSCLLSYSDKSDDVNDSPKMGVDDVCCHIEEFIFSWKNKNLLECWKNKKFAGILNELPMFCRNVDSFPFRQISGTPRPQN